MFLYFFLFLFLFICLFPEISSLSCGSGSDNDLPAIPGLDWVADEQYLKQQNEQRIPRKRVPYARPVPKNFEQAWLGQKPAGVAGTDGNPQKPPAQKDDGATPAANLPPQSRDGVTPANQPQTTPLAAANQTVPAPPQQPGKMLGNQLSLPPNMPPPPQMQGGPMNMNAPPPPLPMSGQVMHPMAQGPQSIQPPGMIGPPNMTAMPQGSRPPVHNPMSKYQISIA